MCEELELIFSNLDYAIHNTQLLKKNINLEFSNYQNTCEWNTKILHIFENTINTYKNNLLPMLYFLYLKVCYFDLLVWIVFCCSYSRNVCILILINVPILYNFQCIKLCSKMHIAKSFSLINFTIIMCECVLDIKGCNREGMHRIMLNLFTYFF